MARNSKMIAYAENNMALVGEGEAALGRLDVRFRNLVRKSCITTDEIDVIVDEMALIQSAIAAGRRGWQAQREGVG